jgi:hypothetical protein
LAYGLHLTHTRQNARDWYNNGNVLGRLQKFSEADQAFHESIRINAIYERPYLSLQKLYSSFDPQKTQQMAMASEFVQIYLDQTSRQTNPESVSER